jgi:DNA-binding XRE family transcriptional regulator
MLRHVTPRTTQARPPAGEGCRLPVQIGCPKFLAWWKSSGEKEIAEKSERGLDKIGTASYYWGMKTLEEYRQERLLTVDEFAAYLGITIDTFYRIKRGEVPRVTTKRKIAKKLRVKPQNIAEFAPQLANTNSPVT